MNLIFNAIESMDAGGKLTLSGGHDGTQSIWLTVADTGQGIDLEERARIFEPFYTTKKEGKGVGLGLSMVYGIIREHQGTIDVDSEPGKGSQFRLTLPSGMELVDNSEGENP